MKNKFKKHILDIVIGCFCIVIFIVTTKIMYSVKHQVSNENAECSNEHKIYVVVLKDNEFVPPSKSVVGVIGCGDYIVKVNSQKCISNIKTALQSLFKYQDASKKYYNSLVKSNLQVESIKKQNDDVLVYLTGKMQVDDKCDISRILFQLRSTVEQFDDVGNVYFYMNNQSLEKYLEKLIN